MTDRELMQQALNALETLLGWQSLAPHEDQEDAKAAAFRISARLSQCERCGKVSPAEIHTCTPAYVDRRQWLYDPMTGEPLINGWPLYSGLPQPEQCTRCGKVNPAEIHTCTPKQPDVPEIAFGNMEPVAWLDSLDRSQPHAVTGFQYLSVSQIERGEQHKYIPVYAAPPRESCCAKCGKVNPAEIHTCTPKKQEPVAVDSDRVICPSCCQQFRAIPVNVQKLMLAAGFEPPFTSPPQREWQGLTDEEIEDIYFGSFSISQLHKFSRAIEAKLKEKNT